MPNSVTTLRVLDLFSGIGGFSLGLEAAGMKTVAFCEREPFCQAVLKKHWPDIPCHDDVTTLNGKQYNGTVDVIAGGFPCQDISLAGKGAGLAGERSGLWFEYLRIIKEAQPRYVIIENVSALRSRGLEEVLRSLAEIGYDAEWHCIPASAVGAPHQRDRVWIVAYTKSDAGEFQSSERQDLRDISSKHGETRNFTELADTEGNGREQRNKDSRRGDERISPRQEQRFTDDGENLAHAHYPRLQGRISAILQERASERAAWSGGALADTESSIGEGNGAKQDWSQDRLTDPSWWSVKSHVGRRFDGLSAWMDGLDMTQSHKLLMVYADAKKERPEEILCALRSGIAPADIWQSFGRSGSVSTEEVLLAYLCKLEENHTNKTRIQLESAETSEDELRGVRPQKKPASASPRSGYKKQRREQHPDTLQALSRFLAYHAEKAWVAYCRENAIPYGWEEGISRIAEGVSARVHRLKALGNSIVPQIAQIIGEAIIKAGR